MQRLLMMVAIGGLVAAGFGGATGAARAGGVNLTRVKAHGTDVYQTVAAQEQILLQVSRTYETGLFGFSENDEYPVQGQITRCDIQVSKSGPISGNAFIAHQGGGQVIVHRYLDLFSKLSYTLTVYGYRD